MLAVRGAVSLKLGWGILYRLDMVTDIRYLLCSFQLFVVVLSFFLPKFSHSFLNLQQISIWSWNIQLTVSKSNKCCNLGCINCGCIPFLLMAFKYWCGSSNMLHFLSFLILLIGRAVQVWEKQIKYGQSLCSAVSLIDASCLHGRHPKNLIPIIEFTLFLIASC